MIARKHRFHGRNSLRFVLSRGQVAREGKLALRSILNNRQQTYRVAVVVSRKVSKSAVVRNRIRRRIYEIVRKNASGINQPYDMVFSVYGDDAADMPHISLEAEVLGLLQKAQVLSGAERATISIKEENNQ